MPKTLSTQLTVNNKRLSFLCVSLHDEDLPIWLEDEARHAFGIFAPYIKNADQVLYVRDIPWLTIDGAYPSGHCYNAYEIIVAVPSWKVEKQQLVATINHELHHLVRWQYAGYGDTLGGAILSEGIATYYEEKTSGWLSPWAQADVPRDALGAAVKEWGDTKYNHSDWFFQGRYGRWIGYGIGCQLATKLFAAGFDLKKSLIIRPDDVKALLNQLQF